MLDIEELKKLVYANYQMQIDSYKEISEGYVFFNNDVCYYFVPSVFDVSYLQMVYEIQKEATKKGVRCHEFVLNSKGGLVSEHYILFKLNTLIDEITFDDIRAFSISVDSSFIKEYVSMPDFWRKKIDYLEFQLSELSSSILINNSFDYYLGVAEIILKYLHEIPDDKGVLCLSHKEFKSLNSLDFYNPLYFTFDYYLRDVAYFIKFTNDFELLYSILDTYSFRPYEYAYFFSRMCFPFFYFNLLSEVLLNEKNEKQLGKYILQNKEYENFLFHMEKIFGVYIFSWLEFK